MWIQLLNSTLDSGFSLLVQPPFLLLEYGSK